MEATWERISRIVIGDIVRRPAHRYPQKMAAVDGEKRENSDGTIPAILACLTQTDS
ncbi:hypothetical protein [Effusibacillus dendaii]|uniref:Uncharacterized protein n=1 Tax=Effusibacillus dendaii TaxID=2743772 RepID=A0A7I8DBA5_9BACL|nr:hypothetical protein [Effusibacillus dendaii]BCJ86116.1 hypothetical protein skT53_11010 [Effusibacillus dendaii]